jgi:ribosome-binding ATPase YchF (GTP1/OBG family)
MALTALQAAGAIHGDFERGFICADVMAYDVLKEIGSEGAVKAAGKLRQEGKNYVVVDGGAWAGESAPTTSASVCCYGTAFPIRDS